MRGFGLELRVETPLFVRSGEALRDGVDLMRVGGVGYLVDWGAVEVEAPTFEEAVRRVRSALEAGRRLRGVRPVPIRSICGGEVYPANGEGVPPSSVKGLLRTAYLYRLLLDRPELVDALASAVKEAVERRRDPRLFSQQFERSVLRRALAEGKGRELDLFHLVQVAAEGRELRWGIYCVEVRKLGDGVEASFSAVGLEPGSALRYAVALRRDRHVSAAADVEGLARGLREGLEAFSRDLARFEAGRGLRPPDCGMPLRLGFGAGRRWKTLLTLLEARHPDAFRGLTDYMSRRYGRRWGDSTVKVTPDGTPVGWSCGHVR